jgi:SAM-dependent methyltransferase
LNAHDNLEEFNDPPNCDIEEGERSAPQIAFYADLAKTVGGPALEIACGSGLVTIPIAAQGLEVTGVDLARPMLEHARKKAEAQGLTIRWVKADARSFDLGMQFQFSFITGNAFQAFLRREDQEALLASVKRHLLPGGIFAFETRNPSGHDLTDQSEEEFDQSYISVEGYGVSSIHRMLYQGRKWFLREFEKAPDKPKGIIDLATQLLRHPGIANAKAFCDSIIHYTDWPQPEEGTGQRIHEDGVWNWRDGKLSLAER